LVLVTAGCDERALGANVTSGSRLREQFWQSEEGTELTSGWWDSDLGVTCAPQVAADGITRCLPGAMVGFATAAVAPGGVGVGLLTYVDAACTQRLKSWEAGCDAPAYTQLTEFTDCGATVTRVHEVTGLVTTRTPYLWNETEGTCTAQSYDRDMTYLRVGDEVPPTAFVALSAGGAYGSGQLRERLWEGEDGSRLPRDLYDTTFDVACDVWPAADGASRCLPRGVNLFQFADPACQVPVATEIRADPACALGSPGYGRRAEAAETQSGVIVHVYDLAPAVEGGTSYALTGEVCEEAGLPPGMDATFFRYPVEAEIPAGSFVGISLEVEAGTARLRRMLQVGGDGFSWPTIMLWDDALQLQCRPTTLADGSVRCVPGSGIFVRDEYFTDDECTAATRVGIQMMGMLSSGDGPFCAVELGAICGEGARYYLLDEPIDATDLHQLDAMGDCVPAPLQQYIRLGEEIPAETFAPVTLVTR
jgi:hypothetical protein